MTSGRHRGQQKGPGKRNENRYLYAKPLPVLFTDVAPRPVGALLSVVGLSLARIESPNCEGFYDPVTRSVWIVDSRDCMVLWRRGFFGKGDLSRSEPSWLARQKSKRGKRTCSTLIMLLFSSTQCPRLRNTENDGGWKESSSSWTVHRPSPPSLQRPKPSSPPKDE